MHTFEELTREAAKAGERNDCAVKAVAAVTDKPYEEVHNAMARFGRRHNSGTPIWIILKTVEHFGFEVKDCYAYQNEAALHNSIRYMHDEYNYKVKNLTTKHVKKFSGAFTHWGDRAMVLTGGGNHIVGIRYGQVVDYTENRAKRICGVFIVTKKEETD